MDGAAPTGLFKRPAHQRARGAITLAFKRDDAATRIETLYHSHPLRVLFPRAAKDDPLTAAIATVSGGIAGGDRLTLDIRANAEAEALVVAQAAEKVYRAPDPDPAQITLTLSAGTKATLEYLPQETIIFDQARLHRQTNVLLDDDTAQLMAGELLVFGRGAYGEVFQSGALRENWAVSIGGRLVWRDAFQWSAEAAASPFGLGNAKALGTIVMAHPNPSSLIARVRDYAIETVQIGATQIGPLTLVRFLGPEPAAVRTGFMTLWGQLREGSMMRPSRLPPIIHC